MQCLHGDREQCDREEALKDFKESMYEDGKWKRKLKPVFLLEALVSRQVKPDQSSFSRSGSYPCGHRLGFPWLGCS